MTDTAPVEDITDGAQKAYASDAVVKALIGKDTALAAHQPRRPDMLSNQENWTAGLLGRLLLDRDDRACAFPPAERVIRLPEVEAILAEAISSAYRKGQEDMRGRAAKVCFQTRGSTIAGTRIRALKIKGAPDAE